jgi:hypothetical protein
MDQALNPYNTTPYDYYDQRSTPALQTMLDSMNLSLDEYRLVQEILEERGIYHN